MNVKSKNREISWFHVILGILMVFIAISTLVNNITSSESTLWIVCSIVFALNGIYHLATGLRFTIEVAKSEE